MSQAKCGSHFIFDSGSQLSNLQLFISWKMITFSVIETEQVQIDDSLAQFLYSIKRSYRLIFILCERHEFIIAQLHTNTNKQRNRIFKTKQTKLITKQFQS